MNSNKTVWMINAMKAVFITFVLLIHCSSYIGPSVKGSVIYEYLIELAVPFFMVLSGYTFSLSIGRLEKCWEWYKKKVLMRKLLRFFIPITITCIVFVILKLFEKATFRNIAYSLLTIDLGPGSYYFALVIEALFVFPLIYFLVSRWGKYGVIVLCFLNALFEGLATVIDLNPILYSRGIIRFIAFLGFGVFIYNLKKRKEKRNFFIILFCIILMLLGATWIYFTRFIEYKTIVFTKNIVYALPVLMWVGPIVLLFLLYLDDLCPRNRTVRVFFDVIGRASFHILSVQMIWFLYLPNIYRIIHVHGLMLSLLSIGFAFLAGITFYYSDLWVQKKVSAYIFANEEKK